MPRRADRTLAGIADTVVAALGWGCLAWLLARGTTALAGANWPPDGAMLDAAVQQAVELFVAIAVAAAFTACALAGQRSRLRPTLRDQAHYGAKPFVCPTDGDPAIAAGLDPRVCAEMRSRKVVIVHCDRQGRIGRVVVPSRPSRAGEGRRAALTRVG